ncbi:hypothetical protein BJ138DRAFT_1111446 [Hygrophoropsis aurantiaca]|uniref:Uncharacterized protein n=1 Tax=Hygrophoropsis aurantiaca TaxID=72124 RepID=A0ACB8ALP7_9AGAM|nr:hypothetical protein BJ138DRAFT_1111446 [Hygrophoropsis aurantiaca]
MFRPAAGRSFPLFAALALLAVFGGAFIGHGLATYGGCDSFSSRLSRWVGYSASSPSEPPPIVHNIPIFVPDSDELDLQTLRDMAARTRGFYVRDYSLYLGWNNMRYIMEASLLHAALLNRTLLIPSFVYARACEFDNAVCAQYATMVNRGDAVHRDDWRDLAPDQQMGWRIPITLMFNITHLRQTHSVMLISDYLRMHDLPVDLESTDGHWDLSNYFLKSSGGAAPLSLFAITNDIYESDDVNRVDVISEGMKTRRQRCVDGSYEQGCGEGDDSWSTVMKTPVYTALEAALPSDKSYLDWDVAQRVLHESELDVSTDEAIEKELNDNGWEVLYTYDGALGMEFVQNVVHPIRQVAARDSLRGFQDEYGQVNADILLLMGEVHVGRKPGALRFATPENRDKYSNMVLHEMQPPSNVLELAEILGVRMTELVGGRMWMSGHMRRGDFATLGWVMEGDFAEHLERIKDRLAHGRELLRSLNNDNFIPYAIPNTTADLALLQREPPRKDDKFYIGTDERLPENLDYLRSHGAVLMSDLLTIEDRRRFGWQLMLTDIGGLVEQAMLARGAYFYGHAMSSVAGGVLNIHAARGADQRTALLD